MEQRMSTVSHVPDGEGESLWVVGDTYTLKATGDTTGGALSLVEASIPAGSGPPPHIHANEDEAYYVLDGELEVLDGDRTFKAGPGSFVFIPRGTLHRFRNTGHGHARMLVIFVPSGFEQFFKAVGEPARPAEQAPPLDADEIARTIELAPRFGMQLALPALAV
jgi:mannose-6-phosphate isomerase-like protein (cupin superfamily)